MSAAHTSVVVPWHRVLLRTAGLYNLAWGVFAILWPLTLFQWFGVQPLPNYPELWQCIGMIVGVYGIGYWIAANDPVRHWPIVLVGLLGKIFGPIGFLQAVLNDRFPAVMGLTILTNDLVWWVPFGLILWHVRQQTPRMAREPVIEEPPELRHSVTPRRQPGPAIVFSSLQSTHKKS